jgi:homoserine kinase
MSTPISDDPVTYASAGVSISSGNEMVARIRPLVASTAQPWAPANIGGFGGVVDLALAGYPSAPRTVFGTDGVGTKVRIAQAMEKHDTIGIDLVAMSVNDIVVQGAKPLAFLDCFTCSKLNVSVAVEFVKGVCDGCGEAGCALVGGETAEMPGLFADESKGYDPTGTAFGTIEAGRPLLPDKESMKSGDILLGLASSGCHSNGYSLIRKIVEHAGLSYRDPAPWHDGEGITVGESLLTPTRIYVKSLLRVVEQNLVKGMAHITGGGLLENVPRMLPSHLAAEMDASTWDVPGVMHWLKCAGNLTDDEFARVLNTGLGMVIVVAEENVEQTSSELRVAGEKVFVVGKLVERENEGCVVRGIESWR